MDDFTQPQRRPLLITLSGNDRPGVTRDRNYAVATWNDRSFLLVDTGGYDPEPQDALHSQMREQAQAAIAPGSSGGSGSCVGRPRPGSTLAARPSGRSGKTSPQ